MTIDQLLVWTHDVLCFVAPTVETSAANFLRRLRIRIAGDVNCFAAQIHAGRQLFNFPFVERALVTHGALLRRITCVWFRNKELGKLGFVLRFRRLLEAIDQITDGAKQRSFDRYLCQLDFVLVL
jgi:hypothetical protein